MERVYGDIRSQRIKLDKVFANDIYDVADLAAITNATLVFKFQGTTVLTKTIYSNTLTKDLVNNYLVVRFLPTDFGVGKLEANKSYEVGFGILYSGVTDFVPINLKFNSSVLKILPSKI